MFTEPRRMEYSKDRLRHEIKLLKLDNERMQKTVRWMRVCIASLVLTVVVLAYQVGVSYAHRA